MPDQVFIREPGRTVTTVYGPLFSAFGFRLDDDGDFTTGEIVGVLVWDDGRSPVVIGDQVQDDEQWQLNFHVDGMAGPAHLWVWPVESDGGAGADHHEVLVATPLPPVPWPPESAEILAGCGGPKFGSPPPGHVHTPFTANGSCDCRIVSVTLGSGASTENGTIINCGPFSWQAAFMSSKLTGTQPLTVTDSGGVSATEDVIVN